MIAKNETPKVYAAIAGVMADIAKEGIAKGRNNQQQGYKFRGIDDVYNALSPILSAHKLVMLPRVLTRDVIERQTKSGGALFYVTVDMEFTLVCAEDGSAHVIRTYGEAMDSGDKATNKAMSAAYKYAAMQAFCIPTEGDNDADAVTHDVAPKTPPKAPPREPQESGAVLAAGVAIDLCKTEATLSKWSATNAEMLANLDDADKLEVRRLYGVRLEKLRNENRADPVSGDPFEEAA